jgi:capsular exopolysaccharide synthesis family protein
LRRFLQKGKRPAAKGDLSERLVTLRDPTGAASEAYRTLRTSLLYALVDSPPKVITVTSPGPGEGKSTTCANLAVVLSQAGKSTLVLDCDFRKPVLHRIFELRNFAGVVDILVKEQLGWSEVWHEPIPGLKVIPTGPMPPNPSELLGSKRFGQIIGQAREQYDYVLIDAPPVELVSDPAIIAVQGDGVLLVLDAQATRKGALRQSARSLNAVGANVFGIVMNNAKASRGGYYYGGYYYGSKYE